MDDIGELPADLVEVLFNLGSRKLVLLEGASDVAVFREWYRDRRDVIEFFSPKIPQGGTGVQALLARILARSVSKKPREYGIIDRDFREDAEIDAALADTATHLFILRRYCIENYLLEPAAVAEELRVLTRSYPNPPDLQNIEADLLQLCRNLHTMMAANWLFSEAGQGKHFGAGNDLLDRDTVITRVAQEFGCSPAEATLAVAEKERRIEPLLSGVETAYQRINGKHILFHLHRVYIKSGITREQLHGLLARAVKERVGLSADIVEIVEKRILAV